MNTHHEIAWATDWKAYAEVHAAAYREAYRGIMDSGYLAAYTAVNRESAYKAMIEAGGEKSARAAILSVNGQPAGCLLIGPSHDPDLGDSYGEIEAIYLLSACKGQGYGKLLLRWGIDRLIEQGHSFLSLWVLEENEAARRFYERVGFQADGASRTIERGRKLTQLRYIRSK
ncbi:GNAT family N-acetyltransferase [Paenibacillus sp. MMS18-CY102]|uniref:GNAT family N-acetyltransferase n=1 Tax=Paenibacillus sp. MMS18-CY102 TaxID=2682849 RepID=UPI0013665DBC|nr:GNAT family N-acetyltransferase [Paenibacillus sp. MMS18-CY102]MWC27988.1 GNAT family N-acetyltransferase [Paenibacillus sp. MMS18-CY102]